MSGKDVLYRVNNEAKMIPGSIFIRESNQLQLAVRINLRNESINYEKLHSRSVSTSHISSYLAMRACQKRTFILVEKWLSLLENATSIAKVQVNNAVG
jgi:hypothetical protein